MDSLFGWCIFIVILFGDEFTIIAGQGNRGVIINNQKLDNSSGIGLLVPLIVSTTSPTTTTTTKTSLAPISIETTTQRQIGSRNPNEIYVTVRDFRPSTITVTTRRPIETSTVAMRPPKLPDFSSIATILNQNQSDFEKIDEIVKRLNVTGGVTQINVINVSNNNRTKVRRKATTIAPLMPMAVMKKKNITYVHPYTEYDSAKDSKELKVQFVLDCDLKDALNRNEAPIVRRPAPTPNYFQYRPLVTKRPQPIYYPAHMQNMQQMPMKIVRATTRQPQYVYYRPTPRPVRPLRPVTRVTPATPKTQIKNVYVDPPGIAALSDVLEGAYSFFEDALTETHKTPVKQPAAIAPIAPIAPIPNKIAKKIRHTRRPIVKRSTMRIENNHEPTHAPQYRYTKSANANNQKQHLTTQIHVTSEYVGKEPPIANVPKDEDEDDADYDDDDDDDDDDGDDYDYDAMTLEGFDDSESDEDDDEYDDSESFEEDYGDETNAVKHKAKRKKRPIASVESDEYDNRDDQSGGDYDDDDGAGDFSMPDMGEFFGNVGNMFTPIGSYVPSFLFFGGKSSGDDDNDDGRGTTPRTNLRRTKHKKSSQRYETPDLYMNRNDAVQEKTNRWYDSFFYGSSTEDVDASSTTASSSASSEESEGFFDWLSGGGSNEVGTTESSTDAVAADHSNQNWFSGLFGSEMTTKVTPAPTTTTTHSPLNSPQSPHQWLAILANHMATTTTKPPTHTKIEVPKRVKYNDYQVWRVIPSTHAHVDFLREYKTSSDGEKIHWLKGPALRGPTDILIPPDMNKAVQDTLDYESIPYDVVIWNLEQAIKYENPVLSRRQKVELEELQGHPMTWYRYHDYEDITMFVDYLQRTYPDVVDLIHIGRSFEGRPLVVVKISFEDAEDGPRKKIKASAKARKKKKSNKPGIFIEGGVHGREWITPAVTTWLLKELIKHNNSDVGSAEREIVRSVDWYILPVSNPDGYEYSLNYDRMWRKTRSKHTDNRASMLTLAMKWLKRNKQNGLPNCYGTDPSRNYDMKWGSVGSSTSPCSDFYAGPKAFSEPETKALSTFLMDYQKSINLFLSLHSYGQLITYPSTVNTSFSATQRSNDLRDMAEIAVNSLRDLASSGRYSIDHSNEMLDLRSATSTDYAMHEAGIKYSFTIELRDTGTQGFLLSPSYIDTTGLELFEMVKAMADYV